MPYTAAQLTQYYTSLTGVAPDASTSLLFQAYANQNSGGTLSDAQTLANVFNSVGVQNTFEVAESTYQFFTGATTSAAGLAYLEGTGTGTSANANGLTTAYYNGSNGSITAPTTTTGNGTIGFNTENRYYNFAFNLASSGAVNATTGQTFAQAYGGLSIAQTIAAAYETIVGSANVGTANANAAIADIQARVNASFNSNGSVNASSTTGFAGAIGRVGGVDAGGAAGQNIGLKAIIVGYILEEANKADVGTYAKAIDQFEASVANGNAIFNTNALTTYQAGGAGFNTGVGLTNTTGTLGQTIALTPGTDTLNTTAGNVTFVAQVGGQPAGTAGSSATLGPSDTINAQGGNNTLISTVVAPAGGVPAGGVDASGGAILNGIQTIDVRSADGSAATLDQASVPNATVLNSYLSVGAVTFTTVAGSTAVGVVGNGTVEGGSVTATFASGTAANVALSGGTISAAVGGGAATNITLNPGGSATTTRASTVNVTSSGQANYIDTLTLAPSTTTLNVTANQAVTTDTVGTALTTINASGAGAVSLSAATGVGGGAGANGGAAFGNTVTTVNALNNTGGFAGYFTPGANGLTVTTGSGLDQIRLTAATATTSVNTSGGGDVITVDGAITGGASLNGGGGARLSVTSATALTLNDGATFTAPQLAQITGFSTLGLTTAATANTYDVNVIGATNFRLGAGITAGATATVNTPTNTTITYNGSANATTGVLVVQEFNAATNTNDVARVNIQGQTANGQFNLQTPGVETVNFSATRTAGNVQAGNQFLATINLTDAVAKTITFAGDESVSFNTGAGGGNGTSSFAQLTTVTSTTSGAATINVASVNTATLANPLVVTTGAGADTITFHDFGRITGGAGNDVFVSTQTTNANSYSSILDAAAGDSVAFAATPITTQANGNAAGQFTPVTGVVNLTTLQSTASFSDYLNAAVSQTAKGQVASFTFGGDTFLVDHNSTPANNVSIYQDGIDSVVRLVGIHTISTTLTAAGNVAVGS